MNDIITRISLVEELVSNELINDNRFNYVSSWDENGELLALLQTENDEEIEFTYRVEVGRYDVTIMIETDNGFVKGIVLDGDSFKRGENYLRARIYEETDELIYCCID